MAEGEARGESLEQMRQVTVEALCEHFANDAMTVEEFERRVERAHAAARREELKALLADLPGGTLPAPPPEPGEGRVSRPVEAGAAAHTRDSDFAVAVFGGIARRGRWNPARATYAVAICGGTELDFREAVLPPGITEVRVFAMWGGVDIIVPPGLNVESHGLALLGGFDHEADEAQRPDLSAPTLRITGLAVMGGVDVQVRYPGETARDARRRRRQERKEHKRLRRGG